METMESFEKPPLRPPTRRASPHIKVWVLPGEKAAIQAKASAHTLSDSAYLRALGLDVPIRSTLDQEAILELAKINGDLDRLGGLLKMWLVNRDRASNEERITALVASLEATQALLLQKVESLAAKT
jgi:hypothetical protein